MKTTTIVLASLLVLGSVMSTADVRALDTLVNELNTLETAMAKVQQLVLQVERQSGMFNRLLVKKLGRVREAKTKVLLSIGRKQPPRAHDSPHSPAGAARDQNVQTRHTQWISVSTQLMSEIQQSERELLDLLQEARRNTNELWEAYANLKEAEARTTRAIMSGSR